MNFRRTSQFLMPAEKPEAEAGRYDIYPAFHIGDGSIYRGIDTIAEVLSSKDLILIDGDPGVFFERFREDLDRILSDNHSRKARWISTTGLMKKPDDIDLLVSPYLGGDDPLFGRRTDLSLSDFFESLNVSCDGSPLIVYGTGASLVFPDGFLVWLCVPKNELQFRARAGTVANLGADKPDDPGRMYKRFYFVDWVVINRHKCKVIERIAMIADTQRPDDITWMRGDGFREALGKMSNNPFRARPWFEPGAWGGTWIKENIAGISREVPNYAWSFELIAPENGLLLESSGLLLEFSFDFIMFWCGKKVLGNCSDRFGYEFPIRFDFLDTFDGGNLSVQCHPRPDYMKREFGEDFTQEECYYILDTKDDAVVFLGFRAGTDRSEFRSVLENSLDNNVPVTVEKYVQKHPSRKHDLFLIPYGTVHGSGKNNLVLEISSTPYIFTFKMYDWLRPDLNGKPRTLNIGRAFENLFFERCGDSVEKELIAVPVLIRDEATWQLWHLPTHPTHLYDVHRYHFTGSVEIETSGRCYVMNLVEGRSVAVRTTEGYEQHFSYAETFIIPAAAGKVTVTNGSDDKAILIAAFVRQHS